MSTFWTYLSVMSGGAIGTALRFAVSQLCTSRWGEAFPIGTLLINISGSFVIGLLYALAGAEGPAMMGPLTRQFFMIGICGGYTTFSSFSLQTLNLAREGQWFSAGLYIFLSVVLCLVGVWLGFVSVHYFNRIK